MGPERAREGRVSKDGGVAWAQRERRRGGILISFSTYYLSIKK